MMFFSFLFFLAPITGILLLAWWVSGNKLFGKIAGYFWLSLIGLLLLGAIIGWLTGPKALDKDDYYGEYIVDRDYFPGIQADWQYNTFRFVIKENDSIYFYLTNGENILKTYRGVVTTTTPNHYRSDRLIIYMDQPTHHIMASNPTTYRSAWSFNLVFYSAKFNNVYFKKGKWEPLSE